MKSKGDKLPGRDRFRMEQMPSMDEMERNFSEDPAAHKLSRILRLALREEGDKEFYDPSEYREDVDEDYVEKLLKSRRKHRKIRYDRVGALVACFVIVVVLAGVMATWINDGAVSAVKGKFSQIVKKEDRSMVIREQGIGSVDDGQSVHFTVEDWSDVKAATKRFSELCVLEYQPVDYDFKGLTCDRKTSKVYSAEYIFNNKKNENIVVTQRGFVDIESAMTITSNYDEEITIGDIKVYILNGSFKESAVMTFSKGNDQFNILGPNSSREEMVRIIENLVN